MTRDWMRALSILVVATPCPLILATPVAFIGGINRAAKRFVIIRAAARSKSCRVTAAVFDKTGTLTVGKPSLTGATFPGFDRATSVAVCGRRRGMLEPPLGASTRRRGRARVDRAPPQTGSSRGAGAGRRRASSKATTFASARGRSSCRRAMARVTSRRRSRTRGTLSAYVADRQSTRRRRSSTPTLFAPELPSVLARSTKSGICRIVLLSGDHAPIARALAAKVGITEAHGDLLPADKARFVERMRAERRCSHDGRRWDQRCAGAVCRRRRHRARRTWRGYHRGGGRLIVLVDDSTG